MQIVLFMTLTVVPISVIFVYLFVQVFSEEYSRFLLLLSILLPLILTPGVTLLVIWFTKHLRYYKAHLAKEIQKNKEKDLILYEQARFVVMGEMMANISHQWKQPLNTINLVILSNKFSTDLSEKKIQEAFEIIESNVNYLAQTVNDFLSFFDKKSYQEMRKIDEVCTEVRSISAAQLSLSEVDLLLHIDKKVKDIVLVSSITQVLLNLISNARDALVAQKKLERKIELFFEKQEEHLEIRCCDSGDGVAKEIQKKIFDPYFTTKPKSRGTGLGLYMSKQIIYTIFGGRLYVDERQRSCFIIEIPFGKNCTLERK